MDTRCGCDGGPLRCADCFDVPQRHVVIFLNGKRTRIYPVVEGK